MKITLYKLCFVISLLFWIWLANYYLSHTPPIHRSSDYDGHVHYTSFIINEHRLPAPFDGWQTYHPPLYYLICSLFKPLDDIHITNIRRLSIFYGSVLFCIILWFLALGGVNKWAALGTTLFMATSPAYVLFYTHYNNDSLSILLCALFLTLSLRIFKLGWTYPRAIYLTLTGIASLYTKFTTFFLLAPLAVIVGALCLFKRISLTYALKYFAVLAIVGLSLLPWLMGHNAYFTGTWFPVNCHVFDGWGSVQPNAITVFFKIPGFENGELYNPYAGLWAGNAKEHCYSLFYFSSWIFGDFDIPESPIWLGWCLFWIQVIFSWIAIKNFFRSNLSMLAIALIILGSFATIPFFIECPHRCAMSFRYVGWTWLPWSFLFSQFLIGTPWNNSKANLVFLRMALMLGIILHASFVLSSVVF